MFVISITNGGQLEILILLLAKLGHKNGVVLKFWSVLVLDIALENVGSHPQS